MILTDISNFISIDKIITEDSQNYIHFVTHIDKLLNVPQNWKSIIYTSSHIFKFLWLKENPINQKYFHVLPKNLPTKIKLSNGIEIEVTMFEISEATGNVAFHFKESNKSILYVGPFTSCNQLLLNNDFRKYVVNGIDLLYLDNTRANCSVETSTCLVGREILSIMNKHPGYKILLNLPEHGYEELILALLIQYRFKISVGSLQLEIFRKFRLPFQFEADLRNADIIIGTETKTIDEIRTRFKKYKRLTVRIIDCDQQLYNYSMESIGLYQINWSPHPSILQLYQLISFITPQYIFETYKNMPKLPQVLRDLCLRKRVYNDQQQQQQFNYDDELRNTNLNNGNYNDNNDVDIDDDVHNINLNEKYAVFNDHDYIKIGSIVNDDEDEKFNKTLIEMQSNERRKNNVQDTENIEIISISSSDSNSDYSQRRVKLPRIIRKNKKRAVGVVAPNVVLSQHNSNIKDNSKNYAKMNIRQETSTRDSRNNNPTEMNERNDTYSNPDDISSSLSSVISVNEMFDDDNLSSISSPSDEDFSKSIQKEKNRYKNTTNDISSSSSSIISVNEMFDDDCLSSVSSFSDGGFSKSIQKRQQNLLSKENKKKENRKKENKKKEKQDKNIKSNGENKIARKNKKNKNKENEINKNQTVNLIRDKIKIKFGINQRGIIYADD